MQEEEFCNRNIRFFMRYHLFIMLIIIYLFTLKKMNAFTSKQQEESVLYIGINPELRPSMIVGDGNDTGGHRENMILSVERILEGIVS